MFEKVSRSLKYDSNFFCPQTYIIMDTTTDHFALLTLRIRGNYIVRLMLWKRALVLYSISTLTKMAKDLLHLTTTKKNA